MVQAACKGSDSTSGCCALQGRASNAERRAAELDSQLLLLGRALRQAEAAALDWQNKARQAEDTRQQLGNMVSGNEKAVQQVRINSSACSTQTWVVLIMRLWSHPELVTTCFDSISVGTICHAMLPLGISPAGAPTYGCFRPGSLCCPALYRGA